MSSVRVSNSYGVLEVLITRKAAEHWLHGPPMTHFWLTLEEAKKLGRSLGSVIHNIEEERRNQ